jgi:hypothetical protein
MTFEPDDLPAIVSWWPDAMHTVARRKPTYFKEDARRNAQATRRGKAWRERSGYDKTRWANTDRTAEYKAKKAAQARARYAKKKATADGLSS